MILQPDNVDNVNNLTLTLTKTLIMFSVTLPK